MPGAALLRPALLSALLLADAGAQAQGRWLEQCLKRGGGATGAVECYGEYLAQLEKQQSTLVRRIRAALARPGTDPAEASRAFERSQRAWTLYARSDCALREHLGGAGGGEGVAGLECAVRHQEARNRELEALEREFQR